LFGQKSDNAKAIEHYEKFLDLWKDADSGIAEVEDARKRLAVSARGGLMMGTKVKGALSSR
jgi:hypothetical protein